MRKAATDSNGNLFIADTYSSVIRKITPVGPDWVVNTIGGDAYATGTVDGTNSTARFNLPYGISVDAKGVIYIADTSNQMIRTGTSTSPVLKEPNIAIASIGENLTVSWQATLGLNYQVQLKTNLQQSWMNIEPSVTATNNVMRFVDPSATNPYRFYRVILQP